MKRLALWLSGGRPMILEGFAFRDSVSGAEVFYWQDRLRGDYWMAARPWSLFRVPALGYTLEKIKRERNRMIETQPTMEPR